MCKFGQNPPTGSGEGVQTRLIFTVFIVWWSWKLGQGHQNLIKSFNYPKVTIHKVWPESFIWFKRYGADMLFLVKIWQSAGVTLKMPVWSESTHWFRRQEAMWTQMLLGSPPKAICPPSPSVGGVGWGTQLQHLYKLSQFYATYWAIFLV